MIDSLISIIVPVYSVELLLDRCVESIINQSYKNIEIILVDDGSPDKCPQMCDDWAMRDSRIVVIHKANGGLSDARNAGLKIAKGEYIGFVDSDDWIESEMYEKLLDSMLTSHSDIAACTVRMIWEDCDNEKLLTVHTNSILDNYMAQEALLNESLLKQPVWYKLYKRETIDNILFAKGMYHEDVFWSYQVVGNAERVSLIDYVGYNYWQRHNSIMGEKYSTKRLDSLIAYGERYLYMKDMYPDLATCALIKIWWACIYNGQMAIKKLPKDERCQVFNLLKEIQNKYPIKIGEIVQQKTMHKLWLLWANLSLTSVCKFRNWLGVGL